jgi:hypothetical protein
MWIHIKEVLIYMAINNNSSPLNFLYKCWYKNIRLIAQLSCAYNQMAMLDAIDYNQWNYNKNLQVHYSLGWVQT